MLNHCICTTDIILEMVWANYHIVYLNKQCVTSNGLFAVDSTEWQIYSINRYQIIHKSFYYMLFHSCIREIFSKRFKWRIAHTHTHTTIRMKCNTLLTYPDWIWDFHLHVCFSHPKSSPFAIVLDVQPHPCILHSSGRRLFIISFSPPQSMCSMPFRMWI